MDHYEYVERIITLSTGDYSRLTIKMVFNRSIGFYMIQIYSPAILIVIISWVSFWLSRDAAPARVALGVTTVLTMTTLMTTTNSQLPKVSYVKSIDMYLGTCFVMVFASLLEYAAVSYMGKRIKRIEKRPSRKKTEANLPIEFPMPPLPQLPTLAGSKTYDRTLRTTSEANVPLIEPQNVQTFLRLECDCDIARHPPRRLMKIRRPKRSGKPCLGPSQIDKYSRILFPVIFLLFNDGYDTNDIVLKWKSPKAKSVQVAQEVEKAMRQFTLGDLVINETIEQLSTGKYARLRVEFCFIRSMGFYIIQIYLPSILVVIISWVSFWISRDSAPARVTLGITTVLTITTLITNTNNAMPPVSYVKAVDIYLGTAYFMVFAALLEYALVSYSGKRIRTKERKKRRRQPAPVPVPDVVQVQAETSFVRPVAPSDVCTCDHLETAHSLKPPAPAREKMQPSQFDRCSRISFPIMFGVFNLIYWMIFLRLSGKM